MASSVIVVGAGFAGLNAAKALANTDGLRVVLIDRRNHHLFQPLLYQVATAGLNPSDIAVPIRVQFRNAPNVEIHLGQELSERARRDLVELGVEVRTGAKVDAIDADGVTIGSQRLAARTVFWAAGVQAERLTIVPPPQTDRALRMKVNNDFSLPGYPSVFVVGDMASLEIAPGQLLPGVAPAAIQAGQHAARMILRDLVGDPRQPFVYNDKGSMATIGKSRAVAQIGRLTLTGRLAWFFWLIVHVYSLIGFRNRLSVLFNWAWNYLFSRREARLITEKEWKLRN